MNHSALTPVFTVLRVGLHALIVGLTIYVIIRALISGPPMTGASAQNVGTEWTVVALGCALVVTYLAGAFLPRSLHSLAWRFWLALITLEWLALLALTPDAAFIVFGLFFLYLHLLRQPWGVTAVGVATACAIVALAWHGGWNAGGVIGPIVGALVAVAIGLGYRALFKEAAEREQLIADLIETRSQLAATEREAGILAERARLAREIHDTLAQGLSSIQLLLHAVERADESHPAIEHVRLARETAAASLAETRRFIAALTPPALEEQSLAGALTRLADTTSQASGTPITVRVSGEVLEVPMNIETALLRVAQGSLANVTQHAHAGQVDLTLSYMDDAISLDVVDNGRGFDTSADAARSRSRHASFGLAAIRQRVAQFGGSAVIESEPGGGTAVAVSFPIPEAEADGEGAS